MRPRNFTDQEIRADVAASALKTREMEQGTCHYGHIAFQA
jgi:hypothetical protein